MASIWTQRPTLELLNDMSGGSMVEHLGILFTEVGDDSLEATMPVDRRTVQPLGLLHGGASVALAESMGSIGAFFCVDSSRQVGVGLAINANHVRSVREGLVRGVARPLHLGRSTQVWEIRIEDERGWLVSVCRLTIAVIDRPGGEGGPTSGGSGRAGRPSGASAPSAGGR